MKKRSLFKRLLSGFVATALAATICFGDRVFNDLFASADQAPPQTVKVKFYDHEGQPSKCDLTENVRFYVVGAIVPKGSKITATPGNEDKIIAWNAIQIDPKNNAVSTAQFDKFYVNDKVYENSPDCVDGNEFDEFDATQHDITFRVYTYNGWWWGTIEPTNLLHPATFDNAPSDSIPDYSPGGAKAGDPDAGQPNTTVTTFTKRYIDYYVNAKFDEAATISADENYYVLVTVNHQNTGKTYFFSPLTVNNAKKVTYTAQESGETVVRNWFDSNGHKDTRIAYHGNEPSTTVRVFKTKNAATKPVDVISSGDGSVNSGVVELKDGDIVKGYKLSIKERSYNNDPINSVYNETIEFKKVEASDRYTYDKILGSAKVFGITADRFEQEGHMQTNFAANYYKPDAFRPDLSEPDGGSIYVGHLVTFDGTDKSAAATQPVEPPEIIFEDINTVEQHPVGYTAKLFSPYGNRINITYNGMQYVTREEMSAENINNNVIQPAVKHMQFMSDTLVGNAANVTPEIYDGTVVVIDGSSYPANSTLYVDGDSILNNNNNTPDVFITLREGQNIVFNFSGTYEDAEKPVTINEYFIRTLKADGTYVKTPQNAHYLFDIKDEEHLFYKTADDGYKENEGTADEIVYPNGQHYGSERNQWYNQHVMRNVIFNFNKAKNVRMGGTAGLFLVKEPDSITKSAGTTTGWIVTAGYFGKGSGEWHFPYDLVDDFELPGPVSVNISKKSVTDETEIEGATIKITDDKRPQGDWDYMFSLNEAQGVERVLDGDKTIGIQWKSTGTAKTIQLSEGNYTLEESGDETFVSETDGKTYKILKSKVNFVVSDGEIIKAPKDVTETNGTIKYTAKTAAASDTITISDAEATNVNYIKINKFDITGENELEGASLKIEKLTGETDDTVDTTFAALTSVSSKNAGSVWNVPLKEGVYKLTETGSNITDKDGFTYNVIESAVKFKVNADGSVTKLSENIFDDIANINKTNGGAVLDGKTIKICDARRSYNIKISKKDVTGQTEVTGATLTVTGDGVNKSWTSDGTVKTISVPDGVYTLTETGNNITDQFGNTYKVIPSAVEFTVKAGKVVSAKPKTTGGTTVVDSIDDVDKNNGSVLVTGTDNAMTVCDAYKSVKVKINKVDITGETELAGAVLKLTDTSDKPVKDIAGNTVQHWTSAVGSTWTVSLAPGTYRLRETADSVPVNNSKPETKYQILTSTYDFTVNTDGTIGEVVEVEGYGISKSANDHNLIKVVNAEKPDDAEIIINKVDITGSKEVRGAVLTVYKYDADAEGHKGDVVKTQTSTIGTTGETFMTVALADGVYLLEETADGTNALKDKDNREYTVTDSILKFTVKEGKVTTVEAFDGQGKSLDVQTNGFNDTADDAYFSVNKTQSKIYVCDAEKTTKVTINKKDITGNNEVEGASLKIIGGPDNITKTWESNGTDAWELDLKDGTYTLQETGGNFTDSITHKNYKIIESSVQFKVEGGKVKPVANGGTVTSVNGIDQDKGGVVVTGNDTNIKVCDAERVTKVSINKKDITGENELEGAKLRVYKYDNTKPNGKGTPVCDEWTSKANDTLDLTLENGTYVLEETGDNGVIKIGDDDYEVISSVLKFRVEDGKIKSYESDDGYIKTRPDAQAEHGFYIVSDTEIIVSDAKKKPEVEKFKVTLNKTDVTGHKELKNAKLTISGANIESMSWTSNGVNSWEAELPNGTYTLKEEAATDGQGIKLNVLDDQNNIYEVLTSTVEFTVENGKVVKTGHRITFTDEAGYIFNGDNHITVADAERTTKVTINKKDITGDNEIKGANLKITGGPDNIEKTWTSDGTNAWELDLKDGTYILEETGTTFTDDRTGTTYNVIPSSVKFKVEDGKVKAAANGGTVTSVNGIDQDKGGVVVTGNDTHITVCDAERTTKVTINKKDITGDNEIKGANLKITGGPDNITKTWISDGNNAWELDLKDGTYTLEETGTTFTDDRTGTTYNVIPSSVKFKVEDGKVKAADTKSVTTVENVNKNGGVVITGNDTHITVCDAERTTKVTINKKDITGDNEIKGAKLKITGGPDNIEKTWTSDGTNAWELDLKDGTYTLEETGTTFTDDRTGRTYNVIPSSVKFKVEDGKVKAADTKSVTTVENVNKNGGVVITGNDTHITVCDAEKVTKTSVSINKFDISGENELEGAKLRVYKYDNTKTNGKGTPVCDEWTSKKGKKLNLSLENGTYILEETGDNDVIKIGDDEYEVISSVLKFRVEDGKIVESSNKDNYIKADFDKDSEHGFYIVKDNEIIVSDAKKTPVIETVKVTINKTDVTGEKELKNAKLTITGNGINKTWTSNGTDIWEVELPDGTYTLKEEASTDDKGNKKNIIDKDGKTYDILTSTVQFTVENGKVVKTGHKTTFDDNKPGFIFDKDNHITVCDAANTTKVNINKTDITGENELTGATLTLTGKDVNESWTSKAGVTKTFTLEDGEYTLKETGTKFTDEVSGKEYKVVTSVVKFKVVNGTVTETTKVTVDKVSKVDKENGGVVFDGKNTFTVCDAETENEDDSSSKKEDDSSSKKDDDSSSKKDDDSSSQKDDDSSSQKDDDSSSQKDDDSSSKKDDDSSSKKDDDSSSKKDDDSSSKKDDDSSKVTKATTKATTKTTTASSTKATTKATTTTKGGGGDTDGDDDGRKTTTTKATTKATTTTQGGGDTDGDDDGRNPHTGHTGSTVAVAGLLAAVAALAVVKKKNDD